MKPRLIVTLLLFCIVSAYAQPRYDMEKMQREHLNRGVVAIRCGNKVYVSWRTLTLDNVGEKFDIYRNGKKLNKKPITKGGNFFVDEQPLASETIYEIRGGNKNGTYTLKTDAPDGYIPIKIEKPEGGTSPEGRRYNYSANDASVGDVDGDGQYEIFLKWDPSNSKDNSFNGYTANTFIDCYRLDGTHLWRIDLGQNIRSGAHYTQLMVYDFDGDGCAEIMMKTADGTIDGKGRVIGDAKADWRDSTTRRIMDGPEYITIFNGLSGAEMDTQPYIPERGEVKAWGDDHANRSERYLAGVAYLDGIHASGIFCRGYYTRSVIAAWDWDGKTLKNRWTFDTNEPQWSSYAGQGNHNLRIADVDGDGCDEITYGSMAIDHDGTGLYNTHFGHGDAMHLTVFDPTSDLLQVWDCHENKRDGSDFRDAKTGRVIFQIKSDEDVGRCMAADIDPTNPGLEMWSSASGGIRDIHGNLLAHRVRIPTNFGIWWDGDLLREMLDHETVSKYDWETGQMRILQHFEDTRFNNGSKSNPCLQADILGDWREEVLVRDLHSTELRLYVTTIPTDYRINCLMEDIPYRLSVASENTAYNQPPETGFYLGPDKTIKPFLK